MPTVLHRLAQWADAEPQAPAQRYKKEGIWETLTAREYCDRVYSLALWLESQGLSPKDVGCIFAPNSYHWAHLELAITLTGARSAGIYPNSTTKDVQYVIRHAECRFLVVSNQEFYDKVCGPDGLPTGIEKVIVFEGEASFSAKAISYEKALEEGRRLAKQPGAKKMADFLAKIDPLGPAFMIYTSGTTANPKGAFLSHDNLVYTSDIVSKFWGLPQGRNSMLFSFLPLCHIAEKLQAIGVGISRNYCVSFATKFDNVAKELPEVQPTLLLCVPRLWEKMMEGVMNKLSRSSGTKQKLAMWALSVGEKRAEEKYAGKFNPFTVAQYQIADKVILSKIREALGLGRAQMLASGAAALPAHVSKWFHKIGLEILEDFGQTETTGVVCMTEPGVDCSGTVGKPLPGLDFQIADDGEILTRGRHVFIGYFKDENATAAAMEGGWLHTGDLGELDSRGYVKIRGRKKEIIKTSGGKMVAPLPIEEELKTSPLISQACMVGDNRKFLAVLVTLSEDKMVELQARGGKILAEKTITAPEIVGEVKKAIDALNSKLASYEQIKRFAVLSKEFSINDGEMTPTLKMKRNVIESHYKDVIDSMYSGA
jgi:long-chain acyl-CoA synthetase